jgi:hypothetical protein
MYAYLNVAVIKWLVVVSKGACFIYIVNWLIKSVVYIISKSCIFRYFTPFSTICSGFILFSELDAVMD